MFCTLASLQSSLEQKTISHQYVPSFPLSHVPSPSTPLLSHTLILYPLLPPSVPSLFPSRADVYSFDHVFPDITGNMSSLPVVILYCQWGTEICAHWHSEMASLASQGAIQYVFRHHVQVHTCLAHFLTV